MPERSVGFRLERTILGGIHEDYDLTNSATYPVRLLLEIEIESDRRPDADAARQPDHPDWLPSLT